MLRSAVVTVMLLLAGVLVTWTASPAYACSCAHLRTPELVDAADEIFVGTLVEVGDPPQGDVVSSGDPVAYTVEVDAVHRGDVGPTAVFESARSGASCGLEGMVVGRRYVVLSSTDGGRRTASLCGGTAPATPRLLDAVERLTGPPAPPEALARPATVSGGTDNRSGGSAPAAGAWWGAGIAGSLLTAALVGAGLRSRQRSRAAWARSR